MPGRLGKYEIIGELGKGGMGVVYKARDPLLGRFVVVKTMAGSLTGDEAFKQRFYREARAAAALRHPNIVTVYELSEDRDIPFIAMEFLPGQSLQHAIEAHLQMVLPKKLHIILQVAHALTFAHRNGIIHRDIKPANIMLLTDGTAKVVDFGIARMAAMGSSESSVGMGTLAYMSPEQINGETIDGRSDIFSLAVVLYELLCSTHPFAASNTKALVDKILHEDPAPVTRYLAECPQDLADAVERALMKRRDYRFQNMDDLVQELEPIYLRTSSEMADHLFVEVQLSMAQRQWLAAKSCLEQILAIDPSRKTARSLLDQVRSELSREPYHVPFNSRLESAGNLLRLKEYQEAIRECEQVLSEDPTHPLAGEILAEAQRRLETGKVTRTRLQEARTLVAEGLIVPAKRALQEILELEPFDVEAQRLQEEIRSRDTRQGGEAAKAEGTVVFGRVMDNEGNALNGILMKITILSGVVIQRARTNADGFYCFEPLVPDEYFVSCQPPPRYFRKTIHIHVLREIQEHEVNFYLNSKRP